MELYNKLESILPFKDTLKGSLIGIEKEGLRVSEDGTIAQTPHPEGLGSALKNPAITTDFSEALLELVTPPLVGADKVIDELTTIHDYVYKSLPKNERFWPASMPCIVRGQTNIPIASYGSSNVGMMKTVYRRGLSNRYGSVMQAIAGIHFNYSFSLEFWHSYRDLMSSKKTDLQGSDLKDFIDHHYMGLTRNVLRYGWLVPYLFGASASVCKSFLQDSNDKTSTPLSSAKIFPHDFEEFDDNTFYLPYATSLRMGDIGYQNSKEDSKGVKANYNSLIHYIYSLRAAMKTHCKDFEKFGPNKDGEYQQLNSNILQIANEYYSSVRPKPILSGNDRPLRSLNDKGIGYIEIRSLDINPLLELGIDKQQIEFLETFLLFCLLEDSPPISTSELAEIDSNGILVAHLGRKPGLNLHQNGKKVSLTDWGESLFEAITKCSKLLSNAHQDSVKSIALRIQNPDLTPSAIMLNEMQHQEKGFFEYTDQYCNKYKKQSQEKIFDSGYFERLDEMTVKSMKEQVEIESNDVISFDKFLENYFKYDE